MATKITIAAVALAVSIITWHVAVAQQSQQPLQWQQQSQPAGGPSDQAIEDRVFVRLVADPTGRSRRPGSGERRRGDPHRYGGERAHS
jgi:hypothetical protein